MNENWSSLFSSKVKNINNVQSIDSYSLINDLNESIKTFPQNFEISTNNGKCRFNKDLVEFLIPNILEALKENESLKEYHFDIDDEQNVMQKIENLFKGESVEFLKSEENVIKQITSFFEIYTFPLQMFSTEKLSKNKPFMHNKDLSVLLDGQDKFPERMTIEINLRYLLSILGRLPRKFKIKTNQNEYLCNSLAVSASKTISTFLESHPTSTEYYFDFNEVSKELEPIINIFNWGILQFMPSTANQILIISDELGITSLSASLNSYIQKIDEITNIIDPYDELFNNLFNIKKNGTEKVAEFIEKSEWAATKNDVQELAACFLLVAKINISIIAQLAELVQILSGSHQGSFNELLPFLTNRLLSEFRTASNLCAFLYHMTSLNLVSIDTIIQKILTCNQQSYYDRIFWLLPEIIDKKIIPNDIILEILSNALNTEIKSAEKIEESVAKIRLLRENCGQTDQLIKSIKNDDVDLFQSIISSNFIDVHKKKLKMTVFDGLQNEISFIDYSAYCGSLKCFKYLFLEKVPINYETFYHAVKGGNVEIIHILDQNKDKFLKPKYQYNIYRFMNPIISAVQYHRNDIFDWLIDNSSNENFIDVYDIFRLSVSLCNAHAILRCFDRGFRIERIGINIISDIIVKACTDGFYRILLFISKVYPLINIFDPCKYEKDEGEGNRTIIQHNFNEIMNASIKFGNVKIFDLLFENLKIKYSAVISKFLIGAAKSGNVKIVKHFIDEKIYEFSDFDLIQAICGSTESGFDELIDYFIGQNKELLLTTEIFAKACTAKNFKIVKSLIQMANEKGISFDLTKPFLNAVSSQSEEIIKLFLEQKVIIDFDKVFDYFLGNAQNNYNIILLLINEIKPELRSRLIDISYEVALITQNIEILKFLMTNKYEFEDLLITAARISNLEVIKTIVEINYSVEFINRIGKSGTALFQAVKSIANNKNDDQFMKSKIQIIEYLLSLKGIDPSISVDSINTPLIEAVKINSFPVVKLILDFYGDNIKDQGKQVHDALDIITKKQSERNIKMQTNKTSGIFNRFDRTEGLGINQIFYEKKIFNLLLGVKNLACANMQEDLLSNAILGNDPEMVKSLLNDKSIDVGKIINNGDTYFHLAINGNSVTPIQRLLLNHPSIDINSSNALKETPLIKAVKCENKELVELILNHPKFNASLSLLDYAFMLSVKSKDIFMILIKIDSLDVNYFGMDINKTLTTALIEATKINDFEIIKLIINHPSFDPIKSHITSCLFLAIQNDNSMLFKYFIELNKNGDINVKNKNDESLLFVAASNGSNSEILNEILNNENFDPIKSDILNSFINLNDTESMKIFVDYDKKHGTQHINFDKIFFLSKQANLNRVISSLDHHRFILYTEKNQNAIEFLLRKEELLPVLPSICTSILSKDHRIYQQTYICKTCDIKICEICARVCHKGHIIILNEDDFQPIDPCCCGKKCKCKSIVKSFHDELYDKLNLNKDQKAIPHYEPFGKSNFVMATCKKRMHFDEDEDENEDEDNNEDENEHNESRFNMLNQYNNLNDKEENNNEEEIKSLKCTFDLAGFHSMSQPMYRCRKCKVDICQSCAFLCHKDHPLNFKGFKSKVSCHCFEKTDCQITSRKDVVCSYAFYGKEYVCQERYKCETCGNGKREGICTVCAKKCHHNHEIYYEGAFDHFCDCGANRRHTHCKAREFPPFNYLSSCTNREQNYKVMKQRLFHCKTCGITAKNQGICEACALLCHLGHNVVYVGESEFTCECATMNDCVAPACPEISCDGVCNRKKNIKDKLFPAFVCLSCNKDGEKKLCKSCALNCHKGHDVHFLQFSNFVCQCDPCK